MKFWFTLGCVLFVYVVSVAQTIPIRVVSYNLLNFPDGRNDCGSTNTNPINRTDTLRRTLTYLNPDILGACEIQTEASCDSVLSRSLNVFGTVHYQRANWVPNNSGDIHNMLFYNADKLVLKTQRVIPTAVRNIDHYILYVMDPTLPNHHDTVFIEVFMCHLKAGSATADQAERALQTQMLRQVLASRPADRHLFVCGDLNTYRSSETCYQNLVVAGAGQMKDPINTSGNWTSNASFAAVHTQSPRLSGSIACGATGGLDDRFDHILVSSNVMSGPRVNYIANSYKSIGNDGSHYNQSLLNGSNSQYPDSVVRALYYTSDHLPVKLDALITLPTTNGLNLTYSISSGNCSSGATVSILPNLGSAPYTFQWGANAQNQTTATVVGLAAGSYCVQVTDQNGFVDSICFELADFPSLQVSSFVNQVQSFCDGSAFVVINGGTAPYTAVWNDPAQTNGTSVLNLCPGTYTCTVTDANNCTQVETIVVLGTNDLAETEIGELLLFPNPVNAFLTMQSSLKQDYHVNGKIYNVLGKLLLEETCVVTNGMATIDVSQLPAGIYLFSVGRKQFRFVKN